MNAKSSRPAELFREVLGRYPTGVVAITAHDGSNPHGLTIGSFLSVSLDPPLVAFCVAETSSTWPSMRGVGTFAANVLGVDGVELCRRFGLKGADRFEGEKWHQRETGAPILASAIAWIECRTEQLIPVGDHELVVGRVLDLGIARDAEPLVFSRRQFGSFRAMV